MSLGTGNGLVTPPSPPPPPPPADPGPLTAAGICQMLQDRYSLILQQLGSAAGSSFSDQGRSESIDRAGLEAELLAIEKRAARIGCPVGGQKFVFLKRSRVRP